MSPLSIEELLRLPISEVAQFPPEALYQAIKQAEEEYRRAIMLKDWLHTALIQKYRSTAAALRIQKDKKGGAVSFNDGDFTVIYNHSLAGGHYCTLTPRRAV